MKEFSLVITLIVGILFFLTITSIKTLAEDFNVTVNIIFPDADSDGIPDNIDNCPNNFNPDQSNIDSQNGGDVCDVCPADPTDTCSATNSNSSTIGPAGGNVSTANQGVTLSIAPNTTANFTSVSVTGFSQPANETFAVKATNDTASNFSLSYDINSPIPFVLTMRYSGDINFFAEQGLLDILKQDPVTGTWTSQNATCVPDVPFTTGQGTCTVSLSSASIFSIIGPEDSDSDGIPDRFGNVSDSCPFTKGRREYQGCPVADENLVVLHVIDKPKIFCGGAGSCIVPIVNAQVRIFDRNNITFQNLFTKNPKGTQYPAVFETDIGRVGSCITNSSGICLAGEEKTGDYLVIVKFVDSQTGKIIYTGKPKSPPDFIDTNSDNITDLARKDFQIIKVINKDNTISFVAGEKTVITGSKLEVIHPQYTIWETNKTFYPFIFTSDSNWTVDVCVYVPSGYKAVEGNCTQVFVANETKDILFTVVEVGSPEPNVLVQLKATYEGSYKSVEIEIPGTKAVPFDYMIFFRIGFVSLGAIVFLSVLRNLRKTF